MKKLIVFDLDGTLAESKSSIDAEMAGSASSRHRESGGHIRRRLAAIRKASTRPSPHDERLKNLSLLPTCGTKFFHTRGLEEALLRRFHRGGKREDHRLSQQVDAAADCKVEKVWGEVIEDRGSQITFSALGSRPRSMTRKNGTPISPSGRKSKRSSISSSPSFPCDWAARRP